VLQPYVLVAGEVLVDLLPARRSGPGALTVEGRFGGSPANVAVGLARLEVPVRFAGRLARSGYGPWLREHLEREEVDLSPSVTADEPCSLAVVALDAKGVASYEFHGPGSADWQWQAAELPDPATLAGGCVHTGSLATALAPGAGVLIEWLGRVRDRGDVVVSYDPNIRAAFVGGSDLMGRVVAPVLDCCHLVKASEEDLAALHPGVAVADVARSWLDDRPTGRGPEIVVVTRGGVGATAWHRDGRTVHRAAPPTDVVDTVGAGDSFTSGLLSSLWTTGALSPAELGAIGDGPLAAALQRATTTASITCSRPGADPPHLADLKS
jgi:fructokinase